MLEHSHSYFGNTSLKDEHRHSYKGETSSSPEVPFHIHLLEGFISCENGHKHYFKIFTGYPIYVHGGRHIHPYNGIVHLDSGHTHLIGGYTKPYYFQ